MSGKSRRISCSQSAPRLEEDHDSGSMVGRVSENSWPRHLCCSPVCYICFTCVFHPCVPPIFLRVLSVFHLHGSPVCYLCCTCVPPVPFICVVHLCSTCSTCVFNLFHLCSTCFSCVPPVCVTLWVPPVCSTCIYNSHKKS